MKIKSKIIALTLSFVMVFGCTTTAFAAETTDSKTSVSNETVQEIPVVVENTVSIMPLAQGERTDFDLGDVGYLSRCGNFPKFKFWVTGGSSSTKVRYEVTTAGGNDYGPFGPVNADGSNYSEKQFSVINANGTWQFRAYISSGPNSGNIVCHVEQVY